MSKPLIDLTLEEIVNHPEFVSITREYTKYRSTMLWIPIKDWEDTQGLPKLYKVTFESDTRSSNPLRWLSCEGKDILTRQYQFHTYLGKDKQTET